MKSLNCLMLSLLALGLASSCGTPPGHRSKTSLKAPGVSIEHEQEPAPVPASSAMVHADQDLVGKCARAARTDLTTGITSSGVPALLVAGANSLEVPPGSGMIHISIFTWETTTPGSPVGTSGGTGSASSSSHPSSQRTYRFAQFANPPSLLDENVSFYIELEAGVNDLDQASDRMAKARDIFTQLLRGVDPGPLPTWLDVASFTSWRVLEPGSPHGKVLFTSAKPGAQTTQYRLDLNGAVVDLPDAHVRTIGAWQMAQATVSTGGIVLPAMGLPALNEYEITFATDASPSIVNEVSFETELLP